MPNDRSKLAIAVEIAFLVLIFSLAFMQPSVVAEGLAVQITDLVFLAAALLFALAVMFNKIDLKWNRSFSYLIFYLIALAISVVVSENKPFSLLKFLGEIYLVALAVLTANLVRDERFLKRVILTWVAASAITTAVGTLTVAMFYLDISNFFTTNFLHDFGSLPPGNYPRIQSTFLYPSILCNYLTISLLMLLLVKELGWIGPWLLALLAVSFGITIVFSLTPGIGGVFLALGLLGWLWKWLNNRPFISRLFLFSGVSSAFLFLLVSTFSLINFSTSPFYWNIFGVRIDPSQRLLTWIDAYGTFTESPFFGKGVGIGVAKVKFMPPSGTMQLLTDAHNSFLSIAGQSGIVGLAALICVCIAVVKRTSLSNIEVQCKIPVQSYLLIAFISAFLYQGLIGSFEDCRHLWVLIGLIFAVKDISADLSTSSTSRPKR